MYKLLPEELKYTAWFCEENIWWLAKTLLQQGVRPENLQVLLFSNAQHSALLLSQRAAEPGWPVLWDYHVTLFVEGPTKQAPTQRILDFDTRLGFDVPAEHYFANTFPQQASLPPMYRTWVRQIAAADYVRHLHSDRSHMAGATHVESFPDTPLIIPAHGVSPITLAQYRDLNAQLTDGSRVLSLDEWLREHRLEGVLQRSKWTRPTL